MSSVKKLVEFNVLGLDVEVSEEDKTKLEKLTFKQQAYSKLIEFKTVREIYLIDLYSTEKQSLIFNLKKRKDYDLTFLNSKNYLCHILKAEVTKKNKVLLTWCFDINKDKHYKMELDRFLQIYDKGEFHDVKPNKFVTYYLTNLKNELDKVNAEIKCLKNKYNKLYKEKRKELKSNVNKELDGILKLKKEASSKRRIKLTSDDITELTKNNSGLERTKDYWNSHLTAEEKEQLLSWISKNIYSIRVYGLIGGRSEKVLNDNYSKCGNIKLRAPAINLEGKLTSQDSIVGHLSFKNIESAPINLFKKVISTKNRQENIFYNNRLNDKNLALFLLSEYATKGFEAGKIHLSNQII